MKSDLTEEMFCTAVQTLDDPAEIPVLYYGGFLGLPLELFPAIPDGEVFGSFRHVKAKELI